MMYSQTWAELISCIVWSSGPKPLNLIPRVKVLTFNEAWCQLRGESLILCHLFIKPVFKTRLFMVQLLPNIVSGHKLSAPDPLFKKLVSAVWEIGKKDTTKIACEIQELWRQRQDLSWASASSWMPAKGCTFHWIQCAEVSKIWVILLILWGKYFGFRYIWTKVSKQSWKT